MHQVSQLEGPIEKKKHLKRGVERKYTPPPPEQPQRSAGGGAGGAPDGGPPGGGHDDDDESDGDDNDEEENDDENSEIEKEEMYEDNYKKLKITPGQIPVKIGKKIFYVQPAIVGHDLLAPGSRISPPPNLQVLEEEEEIPLPLALQVLSLGLEVQKVIKVTREIEVQEVKKVIEEILVYKEFLVCK